MIDAIAQALTFYGVAIVIGLTAIVGHIVLARWAGRRVR